MLNPSTLLVVCRGQTQTSPVKTSSNTAVVLLGPDSHCLFKVYPTVVRSESECFFEVNSNKSQLLSANRDISESYIVKNKEASGFVQTDA